MLRWPVVFMSTDPFVQQVRESIETDRLLGDDEPVIVGVSGGADSMALMHALASMFGADACRRLHVAHLHHGLRGEAADADAAFVANQAARLNLPCTVEPENIQASTGGGRGIEEVARDRRHAFFQRVALRTGIGVVAVAHHADDNVETILHRILRGTGLRGLRGIPAGREIAPGSGIRLVRPLLAFRRDALAAYCSRCDIDFRADETNTDETFTRNRLRASVLPMLRETVNPAVDDALLRLSEQARWVESYLSETAQRMFEALVVQCTDRELVLNVHALIGKSRIIQAELVRQAVRFFELGEQDLTFGHLTAVLDLAAGNVSGKQLHLPGGLIVVKDYGRLSFAIPDHPPREVVAPEVRVDLPGETILPVRRLRIQADETTRAALSGDGPASIASWKRRKPRHEEWLDRDEVHPPLVVRARRPGDRFWPLGAPGSKRIADFLSDEKVSQAERGQVAVLCDQLGPIWLIPYRIDERVKLTPATRNVLKLTATPLATG
jgi:tRNA(Ile)-lysidine synthase